MKENIQVRREYFAGAVSKNGFKSYFHDIFNPDKLNRLYIIKGGSGTGKSRLIRSVAEHFEELGMHIEYFRCAFDPSSLDGVLIKEWSVGILDGTAPHITDPVYPGAVEKLLNVVENADEDALRQNKEEIVYLTKEKAIHMKKAAAYLSAVAQIKSELSGFCGIGFKTEKMRCAARKLVDREIYPENEYDAKTRLISAFGSNGSVKLDTFEKICDKKCLIEDDFDCSHRFLEEVLLFAREKNANPLISFDPLCGKINGLCFPNSSLSLTADNRKAWDGRFKEAYKYINMDRFVDLEHVKSNRQKIRFERRCASELFDVAESGYREAMQLHMRIEKIYGSAMDFSKNDQLCQRLIEEIKILCREQ